MAPDQLNSLTGSPSGQDPINFEDYLKAHGTLTYYNKGTSMMPLLVQDRDLFTLAAKTAERCKKYDVVLYKDKRGQYILHRIIKVRPDGYVIRGDNTYFKEYYKDSDILGIMTSFVRDGKEHSVGEAGYKMYSVLRCAGYPFRSAFNKLWRVYVKVLKRLGLRK